METPAYPLPAALRGAKEAIGSHNSDGDGQDQEANLGWGIDKLRV